MVGLPEDTQAGRKRNKKRGMIVLLDNGHGIDTPGKRSPIWPDGSILLEYEFNRDIVRIIHNKLDFFGIPSARLVTEKMDVPLSVRCDRANRYENAFLISVHANAGGGSGFEFYTSPGKTRADILATYMYEESKKEFPGLRSRTDYSDGDPDKEANFYILTHTRCPAVLTENLFMDNERECRMLMDSRVRTMIADFHVRAIQKTIDNFKKDQR